VPLFSLLISGLIAVLIVPTASAQEDVPGDAPEDVPADEPTEAASYTLDPAQSVLWVRTFKDTALTHDHAIHATGWSGTILWDPEDATKCQVSIAVPVSGLVVDDPGVRQAAGIQADPPDEGDRRTIRDTMMGAEQLDIDGFPAITFTASKCSGTEGAVSVTGDLTVHGVTKAVTAAMNVSVEGGVFTADGGLDASHSDFGMTPFTFLLGAFANGEKLQFGVNVVGNPG